LVLLPPRTQTRASLSQLVENGPDSQLLAVRFPFRESDQAQRAALLRYLAAAQQLL
jgi:hypothetical protein